jgi:hypothetical protein
VKGEHDIPERIKISNGPVPALTRVDDVFGKRKATAARARWSVEVGQSKQQAELLDSRPWRTMAAAHRAIFAWIEVWYNNRRRHSILDYMSHASYETKLSNQTPVT